jgi:hypothetical protein
MKNCDLGDAIQHFQLRATLCPLDERSLVNIVGFEELDGAVTLVCREISAFHIRSLLIHRCQGLPDGEKNERVKSLGLWIWEIDVVSLDD